MIKIINEDINNIIKDISDWNDYSGNHLITDGDVKCSRSAINNIIYFLKNSISCSLVLGNFKVGDKESSLITHTWVKDSSGSIYQTRNPGLELVPIKEIKFTVSDIDLDTGKLKESSKLRIREELKDLL